MYNAFTLEKIEKIEKIKKFKKKNVFGILLSFAVIAGILSCASGAKTGSAAYGSLGSPSDPVPFMKAVRTGTLPSGLRYYILENAMPENRAYLTLAVNAGSVLEKDDEQGLAHFVEHIAFEGTERFPGSALVDYLRSLGMRFGPEVNAYTGFDETVYGIEVPVELDEAGRKRIPDTALAVIDDWTQAVTFDPKEVDDERLVILEEYRTRLGAADRVYQQLLPVIFKGSQYANRRPIGLPEIIETAPVSKLRNFYQTWYQADNMALIFAGDFDGPALEASLSDHFTMPAPNIPANRPKYDLPAPKKGIQAEIFTDPELPFTGVYLYYKRPLKPRTADLGAYREGIIDSLIEYMLSRRFDDAAAKPETSYLGAGGSNVRYGTASRYYILAAQAKSGAAENTLREILLEKETMSRYGFTEAELDRAKRSMISSLLQMDSEKDRQESNVYIDQLTYHFLEGAIVTDIAWELEAVQQLLPGIGVKEIAGAAKDYFASEDLTVFLLAPETEQAGLPSKTQIRQLVSKARNAKIAPPKAEAVTDQFLDEEPAPGRIRAESTDPETGAVLWELSNGAKVILKETANKNNEILLYALARGGTTSVPEDEDLSARFAAELRNLSGIGPYSLQELQKKLADKQVSLSFWASQFVRGFQGFSTAGDLKTFFELLYLSFTQPRIDSSVLQVMLDQYRTALIQQKEDPDSFFFREIDRVLYGNHSRYIPLEAPDLARIQSDASLRFLRNGLNPADYTFVFTGNLNLADLRSYTETYLASIPQGQNWNTWTDPQVIRPGKVEKQVYKGKEDRSAVYLSRIIPASYSEQDAAAAAVLEECLDILLDEEIRQKLGGVYSISAQVSLSPFLPDGEMSMAIYFVCDPKRAVELTDAVEKAVYRTVNEPLDRGIFAKAVEARKKSWEQDNQSNRVIAESYANSAALYDAPLSRWNKRPGLYEALTPQAVQEIGQRLLAKEPVQMMLYPEGWIR